MLICVCLCYDPRNTATDKFSMKTYFPCLDALQQLKLVFDYYRVTTFSELTFFLPSKLSVNSIPEALAQTSGDASESPAVGFPYFSSV